MKKRTFAVHFSVFVIAWKLAGVWEICQEILAMEIELLVIFSFVNANIDQKNYNMCIMDLDLTLVKETRYLFLVYFEHFWSE